ncbi:MAG: DUF4142 domain-containing protein [Gemmatimonadota bacterium]|nr:DUF4142 domain-containing protein [Gemmatimonadota bacterium]
MLALLDTSYVVLMRLDTLAASRATDARVKALATTSFSQNGQARQAVRGLVDRLHISLALPDQAAIRDVQKATQELQARSGPAFDESYLDGSIKGHEDLVKNIDEALGATIAPDVKTFLQQARSNERAALKSAKDLRGSMP